MKLHHAYRLAINLEPQNSFFAKFCVIARVNKCARAARPNDQKRRTNNQNSQTKDERKHTKNERRHRQEKQSLSKIIIEAVIIEAVVI